MNLEIRTRRLSGSRLLEDYLAGAAPLRPFYSGNPWSLDAFRRKTAEVDGRLDAGAREAMAEAIVPTSDGARARLERVVSEGGYFVTTGQQAGLFGGPLYTLYKALSAARLAQELEAALDAPVAPLFWVASEDHDWAEVNHAYTLDARGELRLIALDNADGPAAGSMARRRLDDNVGAALDQLASVLPESRFTGPLMAQVRDAYVPGRSVADAFSSLLGAWLAPFDVLLVDAAHPRLKTLSRPVLARALDHADDAEAAVARQTARLEAAGYTGPVALMDDAAHVFYEDEQGRDRLVREGGEWTLRSGTRRWSHDALRAILESEPGHFSPNVLLRPVVESAVFPTLCYVAGPSELAYFAQIACLFRLHGVGMPLVRPRAGAALIEPKVRSVLEHFGLDVHDLSVAPHELATRAARDALPEDVREAAEALHAALEAGYGRLGDAVAALDPTLQGPLNRARGDSLQVLDHFEHKVLRQIKRQHALELARLERARTALFPTGEPQERVLTAPAFLARFGPDLLVALLDTLRTGELGQEDWGGAACD